jgi:signal transduction histidine kinase/ActR/RegA family two-component response regulator
VCGARHRCADSLKPHVQPVAIRRFAWDIAGIAAAAGGTALAPMSRMESSERGRSPIDGTTSVFGSDAEKDARLLQMGKMEAVGRLAGGVAHDFNNLLTAILGYTNLVLDELGPEHASRPDVEQIQHAAESAAALTRQLLAFSRRQVLQPEILDLNVVVGGIESLLRRLTGEQVQLVTELAPSVGPIHADQGQLEQVLMNLALNARDAMSRGGRFVIATTDVTVDSDLVRSHRGLTTGDYVLLRVSDTGTGMDAHVQAHLFEPFFTTKKRGEGTGLGLATVYGIVKQSGGYVAVDTEVGVGTTFRIYLPHTQETLPAVAEHRESPGQGKETILLVEDLPEVRAIARTMLVRQGYEVIEAESGHAALEIVRTREAPIDLLLTDVIMPVLGGQDLAREVLAMRPGVRVLFASGYTDDVLVQQEVLQPGADLIQKPFTRETLVQKVRSVLDRKSSQIEV